jgi:hypothetical protein
MHAGLPWSIRVVVAPVVAGAVLGLALLIVGADRAGAGGEDSAAVRGYIVPTPGNPDVAPASTCAGTFADNDQLDDQTQSPAGTATNAVTLAGCSYDAPPFSGPSTESRPVAFEVVSGPGGLLCGGGTAQSQVCALSAINYAAGGEYRVSANNEVGANPTGTLAVEFCADDPPVQGVCGVEDEQTTRYLIRWEAGDGGGGGSGRCAGKAATIVGGGGAVTGTGGNDVILGTGSKDKLKGKGGKDRLCGKGGKDKLKGGGGGDRLRGGPGADKLNGGPGKDRCKGGPGKDKLRSCELGG